MNTEKITYECLQVYIVLHCAISIESAASIEMLCPYWKPRCCSFYLHRFLLDLNVIYMILHIKPHYQHFNFC